MDVKILTKNFSENNSRYTLDKGNIGGGKVAIPFCRSLSEDRIISRTQYLHNTEDSIDDLTTLCL